ncbi:NAD(P)-binding domain-containing protein [Kribbella albertanoniae]|uniref:NADP oxidoreductase n=1 Tax=Kribbella albertanoniae TaxID=1266829 RepID=A0A4R4PM99_9ACTN|nr:NAD(P)-binding domain-containing protein [Kribbella albertanoniae]TDC23281.1 NADP oxidoreductase [Kribbella albertanoniae]
MRIGTVGNGGMAAALGRHWVRAGHQVMIGGRDTGRAAETAGRIGAASGSLQEATSYGEVVLLAVPAEVVVETVARLTIAPGTVLIDCTNAIEHSDFTLAHPATAEAIRKAVPHAHVVKAFNLAADTVWRAAPQVFEGGPLGVPLCGDEPAAVECVAGLVRDLGCEPVPSGGLVRAALLEATAAFAIGIWVNGGGDVRGLFPPVGAA